MNPERFHLPRRTFLRGLGATMALPLLEAMRPMGALAAGRAEKANAHGVSFRPQWRAHA